MFDVTKTWTRPSRFDPDGYQSARFFRRQRCSLHRVLKRGAICNHMIGRQHQHRGRMIATRNPTSSERDRRRSVPFSWFSDDVLFRKTFE